jgi:thioredoxin-dependent peroxiredoxin
MISIGQTAPDFTLPRDGSESLRLSAQQPKKVVLYFYPKDDTTGCTLEAQEFTAKLADFRAAGCEVIGLSKDSVAAHDKFCKKYGLGIVLVSDLDGGVCEAYGVWKEKSMYGKTYMGIERTTVLIDGKGQIAQIWPKVKVKGHAEEVLAAVQAL